MVSFERVFEVLDLPLDIAEKPGALDLQHVKGELTFEHVTFAYRMDEPPLLRSVTRYGQMDSVPAVLSGDGEKRDAEHGRGEPSPPPSQARDKALEDLSFTIQPGQLVALVGPSGAGKTTLTSLIPRLYDPTSGRIVLDGR